MYRSCEFRINYYIFQLTSSFIKIYMININLYNHLYFNKDSKNKKNKK